MGDLLVISAERAPHVELVRALFAEYAAMPEVNGCLRTMDRELVSLPGEYAAPEGRLLLALADDSAAGCVGLRRFAPGQAEMKRLYVRPAFRGRGVGRLLTETLLAEARHAGYHEMLLDTLPVLAEAVALYRQFGFQEVPPYRTDPVPGALHFRLPL
jgi:putative acetyltransferase